MNQCWITYRLVSVTDSLVPGFADSWVGAVGRMVECESGSAIGELELIIESFVQLKDQRLFGHLSTAIETLNNTELDESDWPRCRAILKGSNLPQLPPKKAREVESAICNALIRLLENYGGSLSFDDVESVASLVANYETLDSELSFAVGEALKAQLEWIDHELEQLNSPDEVDAFERQWEGVMRKYRVRDLSPDYAINEYREKMYEGRHRHQDSRYATIDRSTSGSSDSTDDEIASMFTGLRR